MVQKQTKTQPYQLTNKQTSNIKQTGQQTKFYSAYPLCHGSTVPLGQRRCAECQILTIAFTCSLGREAHEFAMPPSLDVRFVGGFPPYQPARPTHRKTDNVPSGRFSVLRLMPDELQANGRSHCKLTNKQTSTIKQTGQQSTFNSTRPLCHCATGSARRNARSV